MDTLGSLIDKFQTVKLKINYINNINKKMNLEKQSFKLQDEINQLIKYIMENDIDDIDISRPQHKTY